MSTLWLSVTFELSYATEFGDSDNAPRISDNLVRRARNMRVSGLWGDVLVMALLGLQFGLLDNHKTLGTSSTALELMCRGDTFGQGGHNVVLNHSISLPCALCVY